MKDEWEFLRKVELVINRQGTRPDDPAVALAAGGRGDPVINRCTFRCGLMVGRLAQQTRNMPPNGILHVLMGDPYVQRLSRIFRPTDCAMTNARQTMDDPCAQRFR